MNFDIKRHMAVTAVFSLLVAAVVSLAVYIAGYPSFPPALFAAAIIGIVSLFFLAKDVERFLSEGKEIFFQARFIFRLACFAILLYLLLVRFKLNPLGVVAGLTLPTLCMAAVLFYAALREQR